MNLINFGKLYEKKKKQQFTKKMWELWNGENAKALELIGSCIMTSNLPNGFDGAHQVEAII